MLSSLDPDKTPASFDSGRRKLNDRFWNETQCPSQQGPDAKKLAEYLVTLACSAVAAPSVARGLLRNGRIVATGVEIARLRDAKTCPGVEGFTKSDWALLDKNVARQKEAAKTSAPSQPGAHPDGGAP